jgi:hypothetical protein
MRKCEVHALKEIPAGVKSKDEQKGYQKVAFRQYLKS